jgi:transcriptional regulator with XRE-family HTH domain
MEGFRPPVHPAYMVKSPVGHYLRAWRKARRLSTYEAGDAAGTTHATISRIERGLVPYNQHLLEKLSAFYEVPVEDLISTDPDTPAGRVVALTGLDEDQTEKVVQYAAFLKSQGGE